MGDILFSGDKYMQYVVRLIIVLLVAYPTFSLAGGFARGPYGGVEFNRAFVDDQSLTIASQYSSTAGVTSLDSFSQSTAISGGRVFIGYKLHENVDLELGYYQDQYLKINYSGSDSSNLHTGNISLRARGFDYSILFRPSIYTGLNGLFLRLGGHTSILDISGSDIDPSALSPTLFNNTYTGSGLSSNNSGFFGGIGYDLDFYKGLSMRTQFTYMPNLNGLQVRRFSIGLKYAVE
jgi:Outer membrane protein beta-barrel domain